MTIVAASSDEWRRSARAAAVAYGPARADGEDPLVGRDDVARPREEERRLRVGDDEERLELPERLLRPPVGRQLDGGALELSVELLELPLEAGEEGDGVGRRAGEAGEDLPVEEPADLRGAVLDDGRPHRHLPVAPERDASVPPDAEDGRVAEEGLCPHGGESSRAGRPHSFSARGWLFR